MYCVKCGVRLADSEKKCPICGTRVYHPDLPEPHGEPTFPNPGTEEFHPTPHGVQLILTIFTVLAAAVCIAINLSIQGSVTWSGYVAGALLLLYCLVVMPFWFRKPNPIVFTALDFAALGCYLLYIDLKLRGGWFLSFAFPVVGIVGLLVVTVVTLCRCLRRGHLYVWGGAFIFLGCSMMLFELFQVITFGGRMFRWSLYPLTVLCAVGVFFLLVAIIKPLRRRMHKLFFV